MQRSTLILLGSVVIGLVTIGLLMRGDPSSNVRRPDSDLNSAGTVADQGQPRSELMLYCAASNRGAVEEVVAQYAKEYGRQVQVQYGASQTLLSSMSVSGTGDLFLPADDSYIDMAREKDLIEEALPLAEMQAVVAVAKGNPKNIRSFEDLLQSDVRFIQASPDSAAIGKVTRDRLTAQDRWEALRTATRAYRPTVNDVASDVLVGAADATIVYDAVLHTYPKLEAVELPELQACRSRVMVAIARQSQNPTAALHFARFLAARDRGLEIYSRHGFTVARGDTWQDQPELSIFAGSMLRPAIDRTITAFERREGVRVVRVYNGCGILVAQMKAGQHPDAYFACDKEFMNSVPDIFPEPIDVSKNELVILVKKGNPHNIKSLRDLASPGLRVGVGHEKQCAMGWLTKNTLREGGVEQEVMANVTVQSPTGDMLVNQMRSGSLDAAVVYLSNAVGSGKELDAVRIVGLPCSIAIQPFAVAVDSPNAQLASRLFERLRSAESKQTFLKEGFQWSEEFSTGTSKGTSKGTSTDPPQTSSSLSSASLQGAGQHD